MKKTMWYKKWAAFTLVVTMGISALPLWIIVNRVDTIIKENFLRTDH